MSEFSARRSEVCLELSSVYCQPLLTRKLNVSGVLGNADEHDFSIKEFSRRSGLSSLKQLLVDKYRFVSFYFVVYCSFSLHFCSMDFVFDKISSLYELELYEDAILLLEVCASDIQSLSKQQSAILTAMAADSYFQCGHYTTSQQVRFKWFCGFT